MTYELQHLAKQETAADWYEILQHIHCPH